MGIQICELAAGLVEYVKVLNTKWYMKLKAKQASKTSRVGYG